MSPSCQNSAYTLIDSYTKRKMEKQLHKFSFISARDSWTQKMIEFLLKDDNITVPITPDPVFAFNQNFRQEVSKEEILSKFGLPEKYILLSFRPNIHNPSKEWTKELQNLALQQGYTCVELPLPMGNANLGLQHQIILPLDTLDWYNIIRFSGGYVGHNMHPVIVSLHNNIPFYSFDTYGLKSRFSKTKNVESSKIYDLLHRAGLSSNWKSSEDIDTVTPTEVLDAVISFDKGKCDKFVKEKLQQYNEMMNCVLNILG
jgi:hypothetical protein